MIEPVYPLVGIATGFLAVILWGLLMVQVLVARHGGRERRAAWVLMAGTAFLASLGGLAAAIGSAQTIGTVPAIVPYYALIFMTNVGRGALAMAALILLVGYGMPHDHKE